MNICISTDLVFIIIDKIPVTVWYVASVALPINSIECIAESNLC